jgi:hypothetical protein
MKQVQLLLVGPYPPPYGGIAMTVFDLQQHLRDHNSYSVEVLNIGEGRFQANGECIGVSGVWSFLTKVIAFAWR